MTPASTMQLSVLRTLAGGDGELVHGASDEGKRRLVAGRGARASVPVIGLAGRLFTRGFDVRRFRSADRPFVGDGRRDRPARELLQRGPRHPQEPPNGNHRQAFTTARVPPQASQSISRGPTDAQHARGLLDGQEGGKLRRRRAQGGSPGWVLPPRPRTSPPRPRKRMDVVTRWWFDGQRVAAAAGGDRPLDPRGSDTSRMAAERARRHRWARPRPTIRNRPIQHRRAQDRKDVDESDKATTARCN